MKATLPLLTPVMVGRRRYWYLYFTPSAAISIQSRCVGGGRGKGGEYLKQKYTETKLR